MSDIKNKGRLGVVIGRFQSPYLHEGHCMLIQHVIDNNEKVLILLGCTSSKGGRVNPLDSLTRSGMITSTYSNVCVMPIDDCKTDTEWSDRVDFNIDYMLSTLKLYDVTLYGSRDSFIPHYSGKYRTEYVQDSIIATPATRIREGISKYPINSVDFRKGVIYSCYNRYDHVYSTVDVAIIDRDKILLGKKKGESNWRFIGGFVDPSDKSAEFAAKREVTEECGDIETGNYRYICSAKIDDWRLRKEKDGIMTTFFLADYVFGKPVPTDDISEIGWINILNLNEYIVESEHRILMSNLIKYLKNEGKLNP